MIDTAKILTSRLNSLKVVLSIGSPEVRGWAPVVQEGSQHILNDAIKYIKDTEEYVASLVHQNTKLQTEVSALSALNPRKCPVCDRTLIDGDWCENHGRPNERLNPNDYR